MASSAPIERRGLWRRDGDRVLLCGTLGAAFDRWQRARAAVSAAEAYEAQRLGLVEIERLMDDLEAEARQAVEADGCSRLLPRRSPGYGEMPLAQSREILEKLDATRQIGVALTESLSLVPTKSVTAICEIAPATAPAAGRAAATAVRRLLGAVCLAFCALGAAAEIQVINGVRYECSDGLCRRIDEPADAAPSSAPVAAAASEAGFPRPARIGEGYRDAEEFLAFLRGDAPPALPTSAALLLLSLLLAGAALNLTPCVLPMIPVNLAVIGRSPRRGLLYGLGIALAYGTLGVLAAVGGLAFGTIQSHPLFNAFVALVFVALGFSLCGAFTLDFTRFRRLAGGRTASSAGALFPFFMGALSAVLAGACVAPILVSTLVLTARLYAEGRTLALALPFALGLGMALPWPFLGAGLNVLPRPGAWMRWVNRAFAVLVFGFAAWYATLAAQGFGRDALCRVRGDGRDALCRVRDGETNVIDVDLAALKSLEPLKPLLSPARHGKPVLVDCWATWCKSCTAMARGTLRDPRVVAALKDYAVVRLQAEDLAALKRLPGFASVRGLPAFAVFE